MRAAAIIPAAGRGERMGAALPKALTPILGRALLAWTLEAVIDSGAVSEILVAVPAGEQDSFDAIARESGDERASVRLVIGGETRQESVSNCLAEAPPECELVAVHDAARPLLTGRIMLDVLNRAEETGAAIAAVPAKDTIKLCDRDGAVIETLDRSRAWLVQTPQCFRRDLLASAHEAASAEGYLATDDAALLERSGVPVHVVMGSYENIKVTTPEDILLCEEVLRRRASQ
jgi:2-C-methyl-D-erythritol 4-phosphate cytidylyltransferase